MEDEGAPFANWVRMNASTANMLSIIMLIFAAWAAVEIVSNVTGNDIPPVTGMETNDDPKDTQRVNNGAIIGLGAVAGTLGLVLQLLLPREESEDVAESMPEEDDDIDEVVDDMMEDVESDEEDEEDSEEESGESDSDDEEGSLEEGDEVPEDEGEESQEEEAPEEKEKTPTKKRKF